jgi:N-carbamoylputrescine amidase
MNQKAMRVALLQHSNRGSVDANLDYIGDAIATAAKKGVELILLQELHNGPYFCQVEDLAGFEMAETIPGPSTERLGMLAKLHRVVIVASLFEHRATGLYHNTAVVLESDGSLVGRYRKMHIPDDPGYFEKYYFTPGDQGFQPIDTSLGRLGVLICWDQWFPEAARLMTLAGAELLLYPASIGWDMRDDREERERQREAWLTIQRAHAVANGIPVLCCNRVGFEASPQPGGPGIKFWGSSFACGPQGEWLARAEERSEALLVEIDIGRSEIIRRTWPFLRDRRIDAYQEIGKRLLD